MNLGYVKELNVKYKHIEKKMQLVIKLMGQIPKPEDNRRNETKRCWICFGRCSERMVCNRCHLHVVSGL